MIGVTRNVRHGYVCLIIVLCVCYVLLIGNSDKKPGDNHQKVIDVTKENVKPEPAEEVNVFIILCVRLDGNGNFVRNLFKIIWQKMCL